MDQCPADINFECIQHILEDHRKPIYCVTFCEHFGYQHMFATCGANTVSVYSIANNICQLVQAYMDEDVEEEYYACTWGSTIDGAPTLLIGGVRGIIKVLNCATFVVELILPGHGNAINDLKIHPVDDGLCFSASKDMSIRLWNLRTGVCIAVFAGEKGHRDDVLFIDVHPLGNSLVSCGMDTRFEICI